VNNTDVEAPNSDCKSKLDIININPDVNLSLKSDWLHGMLYLAKSVQPERIERQKKVTSMHLLTAQQASIMK